MEGYMFWWKRTTRILTALAGLAVFWGTPVVTYAQEAELAAAGKPNFDQHCAVCHGQDAKGTGPAMNLLTVKPADLTQLSKRNNGTFPFWKTYRVIDGREEMKGHGDRDMPIWGAEFRADATSTSLAQ